MAKKQIVIKGTLFNKNKKLIAGLKIEAWFKDMLIDDLLGSAITDANGTFTIVLDKKYYTEIIVDRKPDIYFRVLRNNEVIFDTSDNILWNVSTHDVNVVIKLPENIIQTDDSNTTDKITTTLSGSLTDSDGTGAENKPIKIFYKKLREEPLIAETKTNSKGSYTISFDSSKAKDIIVRAYDKEKEIASAGPFFKVPKKKTINLVVDNKIYKGPDQHRQLLAKTSESLEGLKVSSLSEEELILLSGKTGISSKRLKNISAAESLADQSGISKDFFYGLLNSGQKSDLISIANQPGKIIANTIKRAVLNNDIPEVEGYENTIQNNTTKLRTAAAKQTLKENDDPSSMYQLLKLTDLTESQKEKFLVTGYEKQSQYNKAFEALETDEVFKGTDRIEQLKAVFETGALTQNHSPMIGAITKKLDKKNSLSSLSTYTSDQWKQFIQDNNVPIPGSAEGDQEKQLVGFSNALTKNFEKAFPGEKVKGKILADKPTDDIKKFFDNTPDFDMGKTHILTYVKKNEAKLKSQVTDLDIVTKELKTYQRLYRVVPEEDKYEKMVVLKDNNDDSATVITSKYTKNGFTKKYGPLMGGDKNAEDTYANAQYIASTAVAVGGIITDDIKGLTPAVIGNSKDRGKGRKKTADDIEIPDWETLFGSTSYCACEECRSVLSPAAYLVDLLEFINKDSNDAGKTPKTLLFERRPDIGNILLSCENTNTALPYIDLVNEILEIVFLQDKGATVAADILTYDGTDIDIKYQTTGTTQELQAMPEHSISIAYELLKSETIYPFDLPFNFYNKEGDVYIEKMGYLRHQLLRTLQYIDGVNEPDDIAVAKTHVGISKKQWKIISGDSGAQIHKLYGMNESNWNENKQSGVDKFLDITSIAYDELLQLLQVNFINPDGKISIEFNDSSGCDIETAELKNTDDAFFDRAHRFLRLWKIMDWDIFELDKCIKALGETDLTNNFLKSISAVKYLKEELKIDLVELLSWYSNLNTDVDINDSDSRSYYQQLFLNTAVSNPTEPAFDLNADKTALADETKEITDYASLITGALKISSAELDLLISKLSDTKLSLSNLSALNRMASAAKIFNIEIEELFVLLDILPVTPFEKLKTGEPVSFYNYVSKIKDSGFSVLQLDYLFRHKIDPFDNIAPSETQIGELFANIRDGLSKIRSENTYTTYFKDPADPTSELLISDATGEITQTKLQQIFDEETAGNIVDIVNERSLLSDADKSATLNKLVTIKGLEHAETKLVAIDEVDPSKTWDMLSQSEKDQLIIDRFQYLVTPLVNYFVNQQNIEFLSHTFSEDLDIDLDTSKLLLTELVNYPAGSTTYAVDVFTEVTFAYAETGTEISAADLISQYETYYLLDKAAQIVSGFGFNNEEIIWLYTNSAGNGWIDLNTLAVVETTDALDLFAKWLKMYEFAVLNDKYRSDDISFIMLLGYAIDPSAIPAMVDYDTTNPAKVTEAIDLIITDLSSLTRWNVTDIETLKDSGHYAITTAGDFTDGQFFYKLYEIFEMTNACGVSAEKLWSWAEADLDSTISKTILDACKTKYSTSEWLSVAPGLRNKLRPLQRDALLSYVIAHNIEFEDENDVIDYYLIDVKMESDFLTARIKQACSSVQMFIQRSFMGLESGVILDDEDMMEQWKWMKYYRYWEANRKIFLYPENWLEPELRSTKSELFEDLESELLQDEITTENVERSMVRYLESLSEISNLVICGTYYDTRTEGELYTSTIKTGLLHIFGRTHNDPYEYYYRTFDYALQYWSSWEKIDLDIDSPTLTPIVHNNRLYLFWLTFKEKTLSSNDFESSFNGRNPFIDLYNPDPNIDAACFIENLDNYTESFKYLEINIAYSVLKFDKWTPKKISSDFISSDNIYAAVKYYSRNLNFETDRFFITSSKEENKLNLTIIQKTDEESLEFRKVKDVMTLEDFFEATLNFEYPDITGYELINGSLVLYEEDPTDFNIEDFYRIGNFCFDTDDSNLYVTSSAIYDYNIDLPNNSYTIHNTINESWWTGELELQNSSVFNSLLEKTPGDYMIPLPAQYSGVNYGNDFFYIDSDSAARYFARYYNSFYSYWGSKNDDSYYKFISVYHPYIQDLMKEYLQNDDITTIFERDLQLMKTGENKFESRYSPTALIETPYPISEFNFDYGSPFYRYNWELFYHIPMLIAGHLSQDQKFEEAMQWYHFIFNPTETSSNTAPQKYWQLKPFYKMAETDDIYDLLYALSVSGDNDVEKQINAWKADPFEPHVIAELRITAYMKNTVMKYLDNLIAWGDDLFRRDTIESINEATILYILSLKILGDRPVEIPSEETKDKTYNELSAEGIDAFSNSLITEIESSLNIHDLSFGITISIPDINITQYLYFCVPYNSYLLTYWDTVEDRLFKIRNCMNIEGVIRSLSLYEPAIDPALLINAKASGVDLGSILSDILSPLPNYRFRFYIQKATQFCNDVQALGGALLAAIEKKDAEEITLLRGSHELNLLQATRDLKKFQIDEAQESYDALVRSKELAEIKRDYYRDLEKISEKEKQYLTKLEWANRFSISASGAETLASVMYAFPQIQAGLGITVESGGINLGHAVSAGASTLRGISTQFSFEANKLSINSGYDRRWDDWKLQEDLAEKEMDQLDKQIAASEVRKSIAEKDLENTEKQIDQSKEVYEWMTDKYSNKELYTWMSSQISKLYFQSYQLAYDCAKLAQRAFQYELASTQTYIQYGYWDSQKKGLLAGEKLLYDMKRMEMAYYEQNKRGYELTKNISLAQFSPAALLKLREDGDSFFDIPETLFDMDYPGHYMRRIKSVSISIPCIAGPYTTIACTLTLLNNKYRKENSGSTYIESPDETGYDPRFDYNKASIQSIATSTGQRDSGLFQLNFEDERFIPFEGAGAVSSWRIQLPTEIRQFDYNSISDIIIHFSYTAKDGGETLKTAVIGELTKLINDLITSTGNKGLYKLFSMKHDFPNDFYKMQNSETGIYSLPITSSMFPYFTKSKTINEESIFLFDANAVAADPSMIKSTNGTGEVIEDGWELKFEYDKENFPDDILVLINYTLS